MNRTYAVLLVLGSLLATCAGWAGDPAQHPSVRVVMIVLGVFLAGTGFGLAIGYRAGYDAGRREHSRGIFLYLRRWARESREKESHVGDKATQAPLEER